MQTFQMNSQCFIADAKIQLFLSVATPSQSFFKYFQYAFANNTLPLEGFPVNTQVPASFI